MIDWILALIGWPTNEHGGWVEPGGYTGTTNEAGGYTLPNG